MIRAKLAAAVPALAAAEAALATITAKDIGTVKTLGKPPPIITKIMDVVNILFGAPLDPVQISQYTEAGYPAPEPSWRRFMPLGLMSH